MVLYICLGAGGLLIIAIIIFFIFRAKSKSKKNLEKLNKLIKENKSVKQDIKEFEAISFDETTSQNYEKPMAEAEVSKFATPYSESNLSKKEDLSRSFQERMANFMPSKQSKLQDEEDDFEQFRKEHSYSKYFVDESLAEQLKKLSPKMKAVVLGDILKKIDYKD